MTEVERARRRCRLPSATAALAAGVALGLVAAASAQHGAPHGEWHTWGGDAGFTRYAPLDQIDRDNVARLEIAWRWKSLPIGERPDVNLKATPIYVGGVLYVPTGMHEAAALDPATGETRWVFTPEPADIGGRSPALTSRSLAYWTDGVEQRLFHNTLDGRLLSIDARTGRADREFGEDGAVILRERLLGPGDPRPVPFVGSSSPATVVGDVVVTQVVADITSANKEATPGFVRGYHARTGELLWKFHTIPQAGEPGNETWEDESWRYTGNTGVWTLMSADLVRGLVYLPVETPSHDFYGGHRLGDNLYSESIVCLDARTGEPRWHFQVVHHGLWDYDLPAAPILHDVVRDGERVPAVTLLTKQGLLFVFDRVTGEPLWPIEERPVPPSLVPGERASPTQPFPTRPPPYSRLGYHEEDLIDFTPELRAEALAIASRYVRGPMYTPPTVVVEDGTQGTWVYPGYGGGANWNGGAFDPDTGMLFVPTRNTAMVASLGPADPKETNWRYLRAATQTVQGPRGLPILRPPWSVIHGTDLHRGEHVWSRAIGSAPAYVREHPDLQGLGLDFASMGQPGVRPSPLVTKTLLFLAESGNLSGDPGGPMFRAYDKATGEVVAELELPERASGAPMTYLHEGRQYIVIAVSSREHPAELVALALPAGPGGGALRVTAREERAQARDEVRGTQSAATDAATGVVPDQAQLGVGRGVYARHCASCHGDAGQGAPDRSSPPVRGLRDLAEIARFVRDGGIDMLPMRGLLTEDEIDAVSRFVLWEWGSR
ncbi:MAG TPA: PQQ-binding-like beta-propeller repeat protein [Thermoanaerobaculia bacterium]|nr:PQQ-binding-like beta-propeller repeat protein [Thermoanaerobaculia bacterium]